ncbi:MAG: alpha/beta hydrolase [Anaerolineales bacterium]|nr:alpha/beta hydrolase [Anaerolineales bacterium]
MSRPHRLPPAPESGFVDLGGLRTHTLHWTPAQPRTPVLLLHGLASNARIWELSAPRLAAAGYDTWAIDLRGHGLSGKPDGGYGFSAIVADIGCFVRMRRLRRPLLVGHSWGAYLAIDFAVRHSGGAYAPCGLVLVDGGMSQLADIPGASWPSVRDWLAPPRLAGLTLEGLRRRLTAPGRAWTPNARAQEILIANFEVDSRGRIRPHLTRRRHLQLLRSIWEYRAYQAYAALSCPVLLLPAVPPSPRTPDEDRLLAQKRRGVAIACERIREVQVSWMRDTIHDVPLQRPLALANQILRFAGQVV